MFFFCPFCLCRSQRGPSFCILHKALKAHQVFSPAIIKSIIKTVLFLRVFMCIFICKLYFLSNDRNLFFVGPLSSLDSPGKKEERMRSQRRKLPIDLYLTAVWGYGRVGPGGPKATSVSLRRSCRIRARERDAVAK